jgi:outer membrane protein assembly factor BamB
LGQQHPGWQGNQNQPPGHPPSGGFLQPQPPQSQYPGYQAQPPYPQQQPGYGQWNQPPPGYPPPGKKSTKKLWLWLAPVLVVVVAAAVVVPIVLTSDSGSTQAGSTPSDPGQPAPASKNWQVHLDRPDHEGGLGAWEVGDTVVVAYEGKVTAFAETDGKQVWQATPPGGVGKFCGVGTRVVNDQMAVAFGKELDNLGDPACKFAALLNMKTGQFGWQQPMEVPQSVSPERARKSAALEIMGDVVVVGQDFGTIGLDLATGTRRWVKPVVKPTGNDLGNSSIVGMLPAKQSVLVSIAGFLSDPSITFASLDPATGTLSQGMDYSSKDTKNRFSNPRLVSADPPVALVSRGTGTVCLVLDDKFGKTGVIEAGDPGGPDSPQLDAMGFNPLNSHQTSGRFLMSGGLLVTVTTIQLNGTNKLVAYDIASGSKKWERPIPDGNAIMPLAVESDSVVTLVSPAESKRDQRIARFSLADGTPGPVASYPLVSQSGDSPLTQDFRYFWHDERLWGVRGPSNQYDLDAFSIGK